MGQIKNIVYDGSGRLCAAKVAFWLTLFVCFGKILYQDEPDYSGLALFLSPVAATYFGRSKVKDDNRSKQQGLEL